MDFGNLDIISSREFYDICNNQNNKIIKFGKVNQPKVYEKNDGHTIIKLFYPKQRLLSSDRIKPRAMRFYNNVKSLHTHGYDVPKVNKVQFCPELKMYVLYYSKIQGNDIRTLAKHDLNIIYNVADLLADLHKNGIFFRSIHLENLLSKPDGNIALLDLTDVKFKSRALTIYLRYRNIKHLLQEPNDRELWQAFGVKNFMDAYFKSAKLSNVSRALLSMLIKRNVKVV